MIDSSFASQIVQTHCTAFDGKKCVASGGLKEVALSAKQVLDQNASAAVLIFDDLTSEVIEVDFRGTSEEVLKRLVGTEPAKLCPTVPEAVPRGPGRPRLGVVAREVTLLPRHWDWLGTQPGGASVALRKLVEAARKANAAQDRKRQAREAAYRFMSAMAGNETGFEEAARALFAGDQSAFNERVAEWPVDVREYAKRLAAGSWPTQESVEPV